MTKSKKDTKWFFATNTENVKNIIAQGLITGPQGFMKYYSDALELFPDWIPLFKDGVPLEIFEKSVSEDSELKRCILEISVENIKGKVKAYKHFGLKNEDGLFQNNKSSNSFVKIEDVDLGSLFEEGYEIKSLFIPAPIPIACIRSIIFEKKNDKNEFEKEANDIYGNVPLVDLKLKVDEKLFLQSGSAEYLNEIKLPTMPNIDYSKTYAYGGMLAVLFYFAKNGKLSNSIYHLACNLDKEQIVTNENIKLILNHFLEDAYSESNKLVTLYYKLLDILIYSRGSDIKDDIIELLKGVEDGKFKKRAQEIANSLVNFETISHKTVSEIFQETKTPLEKMLIMLFLRENSEDLIEYHSDKFDELDYLLFAMVFGIRDKFINTPKFLREFVGLQNFITTKMANFAHENVYNSDSITFSILLGEPPTLTDMLENEKFAIWFANKNKIDSLKTTITIPKGDYILKVLNSGIEIVFKDKPKNIRTEIVEDKLYKTIINVIITESEYKKYLEQYKKMKK